ncbi:hypothetical protein QJS10_CPA06g00374 [Acorus calamus]|uniref:MBD domain-containing protein n=1 Tax=Acorus calamus TaxID=4465 RepID=A0AAV9ELP2_ACOCL|nr:hypothetical protein QJS10_CPA06g00374 [Acorus calamus]
MATEDKPKWLPDGWMVEVRRRSSSGHKYKIYVDPVTRYKFYSKPQVFRHLNIGDLEISSDKQNKTSCGICSSDIFEHSPDGLPPGWIKQIKARQHSPLKKDQYYIDPVNGYIFRSRKAVFDYLDTGKIPFKVYKPKQIENDVNSVDNKLSHYDAVERQNVHGSSASRCLFPDRGSNSSGKSIKDNYAQSTKMELTDAKIANDDSSQMENVSSMVVVREASALSPVKQTNKPCNDNPSNSTSPSDEPAVRVLIIDLTEERPPESCQAEDQKPVDVAKDELSQSKLKQLEDPVDEKSFDPSLKATNERLSPDDGVKRQRKRKLKDKLLISGPRRTSKRLAGSSMVVMREASSLSPVKQTNKPYNENRTDSTSTSDEPAVRVLIIDLTEERPPESCQVEDQKPVEVAKDELSQSKIKQLDNLVDEKSFDPSLKATYEGLSPDDGVKRQRKRKLKDKLLISGPRRTSKRLAGIEAKLALDSRISDQALQRGGGSASQPKFAPSSEPYPNGLTLSNKVMDDQSSLENQLVVGDTPGSPLTFPFGDSWPDPCIEFAFKTLTGAAPVLEDVSVIEDFFNQHLGLGQVPVSSNSHVHINSDNGSQKANMYQVEVQMQGKQSISTAIHSGGKSNNKC